MIEKIPNKEVKNFLTLDNKKKYPKLYNMFLIYYRKWQKNESQYIIK